jgi:hypothetical protein
MPAEGNLSEKEDRSAPPLEDLERLKAEGKPVELVAALGAYLKDVGKNFIPNDLDHSLQFLRGTVRILKEDTDRCQERYHEAFRAWAIDKQARETYKLLQFELRQLIRTFFAEADGTIYAARQVLLWAHDRKELLLLIPELALLREESYRFNRRSKKAESRPAFNSTIDSLLLTFSLLPGLRSSGFVLNLSDHGWECFQKLLEVRNNITHPKQLTHLAVDAEVITQILPAARSWYYRALAMAVGDPELTDAVVLTGSPFLPPLG